LIELHGGTPRDRRSEAIVARAIEHARRAGLEEAIAAEQLGDGGAAQMQLLAAVGVEIGEPPLLPQPLLVGARERLGELEPGPLECARLLERVGALGIA